jgi:hypothetical protein
MRAIMNRSRQLQQATVPVERERPDFAAILELRRRRVYDVPARELDRVPHLLPTVCCVMFS